MLAGSPVSFRASLETKTTYTYVYIYIYIYSIYIYMHICIHMHVQLGTCAVILGLTVLQPVGPKACDLR